MLDRQAQRARQDIEEQSKPRSKEEVALWRRLLDPKQTTVVEFLEAKDLDGKPIFWITTKETQKDGTAQTPLVLWPNQLYLVRNIYEMWADGEAAKLRIPKDREQGISFCIQAVFAWCFLTGGGGAMVTISHVEEATQGLCEDFDTILSQVPPWVYREILGAKWTSRRAGRWRLEFPRHRKCRAKTLTCRDKAMGRGERPRWMHLSERPHWQTGKKSIRSALTVLRDKPGNIYVDESTGKDYDDFYDGCVAAREGRSNWRCLFFSALTHPMKRVKFKRPADADQLEEEIGLLHRFGMKEEMRWRDECVRLEIERTEMLERLKWRREQIASVFSGDIGEFTSEHPITFDECFRIDSSSAFDVAILDSWMRIAEQDWKLWERGNLEVTGTAPEVQLEWVPARLGRMWLKKRPIEGHSYTFGCDPASGKKTVDQGKSEADFATILVRDLTSKEFVLLYEHHTAPEVLQIDLLAISKWYGWAKGYPESNNDGKILLSPNYLPRLQEDWEVPDEVCLAQIRTVVRDGQHLHEPTLGWWADSVSKHVAVNRVKAWIRQIGAATEKDTVPPIPWPALKQCRGYIVIYKNDAKNGYQKASGFGPISGHDDLVSALYLCMEAAEWLDDPQHSDRRTKVDRARQDDRCKRDPWYEFNMEAARAMKQRGSPVLRKRF